MSSQPPTYIVEAVASTPQPSTLDNTTGVDPSIPETASVALHLQVTAVLPFHSASLQSGPPFYSTAATGGFIGTYNPPGLTWSPAQPVFHPFFS